VPNEDTSKNREIRQALALVGRRSMMKQDNNQLGVGGRVRRDVGEEARGSCSVWGGGVQLFEVTNSAQKLIDYIIHCCLRRPLDDEFTHNNQPKTGADNRGE
jgi:hypothetical protein